MNIKLIIGIIILVTITGCKISAPSRDLMINRDTSRNTIKYETVDDGNCPPEDNFCPPPEEYK